VIDSSATGASWFLWIVSTVFLLAFALPLTFAPLGWARIFRWPVGQGDDLTRYFGRCLGAVALALVAAGYRAALDPREHAIVLELFAGAAFLLGLVHVWGAITRQQPWTENAEIVLYLGLGAVAVWLRTALT
jgi:hypothetical protein